jgi:nicotinamidase-related amidase
MQFPWLAYLTLPLLAAPADVALRSRVEAFKGSGDWREAQIQYRFDPAHTALVLCDVWDRHWCSGANARVAVLAPKMQTVVEAARKSGVLIIHAPSDTMDFYKDYPQRQAILHIAHSEPPAPKQIDAPPLPIDDSRGGCDTEADQVYQAWTRQHAAIQIAAQDLISDNGAEIYNALQARGIDTLLVAGVHTNMCILNRSFAIKQMTKWGVRCILLRDLTDAMYSPKDRPYVSHEAGTELVIQHIEKYWCPTALSSDLLQALKTAGK